MSHIFRGQETVIPVILFAKQRGESENRAYVFSITNCVLGSFSLDLSVFIEKQRELWCLLGS